MLEIISSDKSGIDISGNVDELHELKQSILALLDTVHESLVINAKQDFDPSPYDAVISKMIISNSNCPTKVSYLNSKEIQVEGLPENLLSFVSCIDAAIESGSHAHYEFYEGKQWIARESIPVVISVK